MLSGYHSGLVPTAAAQMGTDANMTDNNTGGMTGQNMMSKMKGENVTGLINLMSIFSKAIGAEVKASLVKPQRVQKAISEMALMQWPLTLVREWIP